MTIVDSMVLRRVWRIKCEHNGFEYPVFVEATEARLQKYLETELPIWRTYHALTQKEVEAVKSLRMKIYFY